MSLDLSMMTGREELAGLDIGESSISVAKLKVRRGGLLEVSHAGSIGYDPDKGDGEITRAINELWRRCQMPFSAVCSCLHSPSSLVRPFQYPSLTDVELSAVLRLVAEEELQIPADQLQMDWHIFGSNTPPGAAEGTGQTEGFLVAVPSKETQRHVDLLEAANLYPAVLDIGCTAIANLYLNLRTEAQRDEVVCLVHLNGHSADLAIIYGAGRLYPRTFYSPGRPWEEAWVQLAEDIRVELNHFQFKLNLQTVQRVLLVGTLAAPAELVGRMEESLLLPVQHWDPMQDPRLRLPRSFQGAMHTLSATSLGLAIRTARYDLL